MVKINLKKTLRDLRQNCDQDTMSWKESISLSSLARFRKGKKGLCLAKLRKCRWVSKDCEILKDLVLILRPTCSSHWVGVNDKTH